MPLSNSRPYKQARAFALAALCLLPAASYAQNSAQEDSETYEMTPLIVSAKRFDSDAGQVAASIMQVDANTISEKAATSVSDLLSDLGVMMRSTTGNPAQSTIDMRGYGESGNLNTLVLIDGRRINSPDMSGINWLNMPLVGIDKIEVLRGSQSALYGNNAGGGVIDISTSIPEGRGSAAIISYGSWQTWGARAAVWTPISDSIRSSTEFGFIESDGYRDNSAYKTRTVSQSLQGKAGKVEWKASAGYDDNWFLFPGALSSYSYKIDPRLSDYAPNGANFYSESENYYASGAADWKGDALELHADLNWTHTFNPWNMGVGLGAERTLDTWKFAPRARMEWEHGISLILGADGEYDSLLLGLFNDLDHTDRSSHSRLKRATVGLYSNLSWTGKGDRPLTIDLTARAQKHTLRYHFVDDSGTAPEDKDDKTGSDTAFSLGTTWQATKSVRIWARADRFFRYPAIDEIVAYQGYDLSVPFNKDLDSEYGWSGEMGVDWSIPHAMLRVNAFTQDVKDLIAFDYMQNLNVNLADATRTGMETSAQFAFKHWKGGLFYTLLHVELDSGPYEGKELYLVPRNQFSGFVEWLQGRFSVRVSGRYTGSQWQGNDFTNTRAKMQPFFVMDLIARMRVSENLHIFAGVDNALDRQYSALRYSGLWYPSASRSFKAGIQLRY